MPPAGRDYRKLPDTRIDRKLCRAGNPRNDDIKNELTACVSRTGALRSFQRKLFLRLQLDLFPVVGRRRDSLPLELVEKPGNHVWFHTKFTDSILKESNFISHDF